ncbi:MAG: hypothetical protein IID46_02170 [Planctomycetes bacterium]|nr:hypothetical protein [Planctomycetota bacterium]
MAGSSYFSGGQRSRLTRNTLSYCLTLLCLMGCSDQDADPPSQQSSGSPSSQTAELQVSVRFVKSPNDKTPRVEVGGLRPDLIKTLNAAEFSREQWTQLLKVSVAARESDETLAMLGKYRVENGQLVFEPRFPLKPGLKYSARFDPSKLPGEQTFSAEVVSAEFSLPPLPASEPAVVEHIYPSSDKLPENQLKFYIHFSAPMSSGEAYEHVHLIKSSGEEVDYPFLKLGEELWDPSGTRFTLFIDPGRIKRGLKPREDLGPSLEEGKSYTLLVDAEWRDAHDQQLKAPYKKSFQVIAPDERQPDPKKWKLSVPPSGTTDPLVVTFTESLDHAMLQRVLLVLDSDGKLLSGKITVDQNETRWQFRPQQFWSKGSYSLEVETILEDLAGNSIARPFEVDVFKSVEKSVTVKTLDIPFEISIDKRSP